MNLYPNQLEDPIFELAKKYNPDVFIDAAVKQNASQASPYFGMTGAPYASTGPNPFPFSTMIGKPENGLPMTQSADSESTGANKPYNPLSPQAMQLLSSMLPQATKPQYAPAAGPRQPPQIAQMANVMASGAPGGAGGNGLAVDIPSLAALINGAAYKR